jgi:hypothetical protein
MARVGGGSQGLRAELEQADHEIALLREELDLKDARWIRLSPRRRSHYMPVQRLRILRVAGQRLVVGYLEGREPLPVVELREAA